MLFIFNWSSSQSWQNTDLPPYRFHFYSQKTSYRMTHHLLKTSNPTLDSDCWICLSISLPGGLALPIFTAKWTHINTSLHHTYRGEPLFLSYIHYLCSIDQIHNPNKILTSLLADLTSTHKGPAIGGPTTSDVCLQQQAPFCFSRQNSMNNSYPQLGTIPSHLCSHTSHLSFPSGRSVYHVSGTAGHSLTFSGRLPSAFGINTPIVGATLVSSLLVSETTNKFLERLIFAINFSCCLLTPGIFFLCGTITYSCLPTNWTGICTLVYLAPDISIAPIRPFLSY